LRELGVEPLQPDPGQCFVRLLVGDARPPGPNPQGGPTETLVLDMNQQPAVLGPLPALAGFAKQWHALAAFHTSLTVRTGELNPMRMPLPFIAGHVWTIVIVRESTQRTEIHRYLQRLEPLQPFDDTIRLVEQLACARGSHTAVRRGGRAAAPARARSAQPRRARLPASTREPVAGCGLPRFGNSVRAACSGASEK
jgi:hypothetical protein